MATTNAILASVVAVSCGNRHSPPDAAVDAAIDAPVAAPGFPSFALGVEYTALGVASTYGGVGVKWAKTWLEAFSWGAVEPAAPTGLHVYNWTTTDAMIADYQSAGITRIQSYLGSSSPWGSVSLQTKDIMPKPQYMADFRAWVRAIIERYDGDGVDDMPGLAAPVRFWVVGGEWTGFWGSGNATDYLTLLAATREEAKLASPDVLIGAIPFLLVDVFEGNEPTDEEIAQRLLDPPPPFRNSTAGMHAILDRGDLFDYVNVHSLGDYTEIPPMLRWFRAQMQRRGYDKPIWIDDAFPMSFLVNYHPSPTVGWPAMYPVTDAIYQAVYDQLVAVAQLAEPAYTPAMTWLRAETATGTVKKVVTALGEGAVGIQIGNTEDWMHDTVGGVRHVTVNLIGAAAMMGMIDVTHPSGYANDKVRVAGAPRPAFRNLALLIAKLGDGMFASIERVTAVGVRGYRFVNPSRSVWVVWHEDDVLQLPGEAEIPFAAMLPVPGLASARVTYAMTDVAATSPMVETIAASGGMLPLSLTSTPVFVEPP